MDEPRKIFPLKSFRMRMFEKLFNMNREGTMDDFAKALGGTKRHRMHNEFVRDMIAEGVLIPARKPVLILGRNYANYSIDKERMMEIAKYFFDDDLMPLMQALVDDGYLVFRF